MVFAFGGPGPRGPSPPVRVAPEGLTAALKRGLPQACLVTGVEPLLISESCDAIRASARAEGYADREVHFLERGFDWQGLHAAAANLSLFASRRLIELRLSSALDTAGARSLAELANQPPEDALVLVSGVLEFKAQKAAWVAAFERSGLLVIAQQVERPALPGWIRQRLRARGVEADAEAVELIADRVEGNLLAAQQEVERIVLLMPGSRLGAADAAAVVSDSARFDVFELAAAAFAGNAARALRILAGLRAEGREPPLILWALVSELRALSRVRHRLRSERSLDQVFRAERVWSSRQPPLRAALGRIDGPGIDRMLLLAARTDRVAKGSMRGDPWTLLERLVAEIAGQKLAA
jgi:DNA polymerase-3 subunit delta